MLSKFNTIYFDRKSTLYKIFRVPENDPYWRFKPPTVRKECLHQQVTRAVPDFYCHLGPRQIVRVIFSMNRNPTSKS